MHCATFPSKSLKWLCLIIISLLMFELLLFNVFILYGYKTLHGTLSPLLNAKEKQNWMSGLEKVDWLQRLVISGKSGGFVSAIQNTLGRLFIIYNSDKSSHPQIATFSLDVSHSGEFLFIYKRILSRRNLNFTKLVIDVGANDGILSSNSFGFIQLGWNALLVEPLQNQIDFAKRNLERYVDQYKENQTVKIIQAVLSDNDGTVPFAVSEDLVSMEGHVIPPGQEGARAVRHHANTVPSMTVKTFTRKHNVPTNFGLLSVDAEGMSNKILHAFIDLGFRPAFIVYEVLHESANESPDVTIRYMIQNGYRYLTRRGWNMIFELQLKDY